MVSQPSSKTSRATILIAQRKHVGRSCDGVLPPNQGVDECRRGLPRKRSAREMGSTRADGAFDVVIEVEPQSENRNPGAAAVVVAVITATVVTAPMMATATAMRVAAV